MTTTCHKLILLIVIVLTINSICYCKYDQYDNIIDIKRFKENSIEKISHAVWQRAFPSLKKVNRMSAHLPILLQQHQQQQPIDEEIPVLIVLTKRLHLPTHIDEKLTIERIQRKMKLTKEIQKEILIELKRLNIKDIKPFWITNAISIKAKFSTIRYIAKRQDVALIEPNFEFTVKLEEPLTDKQSYNAISQSNKMDTINFERLANITAETYNNINNNINKKVNNNNNKRNIEATVEWNINFVNAPKLWDDGIDGSGIVVASADTGVSWQHNALITKYRGYQSAVANHTYNWWDAVHATGSVCGASSPQPCDDHGHGTHTVGTMLGFDGLNHIGVAPNAQWIGCRNMNANKGTPTRYIECLEFFIAPHDENKENPLPSLRPHVIGNSYGCTQSEGCDIFSLQNAVQQVVNAGIFMSVAAGNNGPSCNTVTDPPAPYKASLSVAASSYGSLNIAYWSSRGPVIMPSAAFVKPDITAPGEHIQSSFPGNGYVVMSGTSMATPHMVGLVALLWQKLPDMQRNVTGTIALLEQSASTHADITCNQNVLQPPKNSVYGFGNVDILTAIDLHLSQKKAGEKTTATNSIAVATTTTATTPSTT